MVESCNPHSGNTAEMWVLVRLGQMCVGTHILFGIARIYPVHTEHEYKIAREESHPSGRAVLKISRPTSLHIARC